MKGADQKDPKTLLARVPFQLYSLEQPTTRRRPFSKRLAVDSRKSGLSATINQEFSAGNVKTQHNKGGRGNPGRYDPRELPGGISSEIPEIAWPPPNPSKGGLCWGSCSTDGGSPRKKHPRRFCGNAKSPRHPFISKWGWADENRPRPREQKNLRTASRLVSWGGAGTVDLNVRFERPKLADPLP